MLHCDCRVHNVVHSLPAHLLSRTWAFCLFRADRVLVSCRCLHNVCARKQFLFRRQNLQRFRDHSLQRLQSCVGNIRIALLPYQRSRYIVRGHRRDSLR